MLGVIGGSGIVMGVVVVELIEKGKFKNSSIDSTIERMAVVVAVKVAEEVMAAVVTES